ncbi:MAG TPA: hypothetical protein VIT83_05190 [Gammaproteobacteria bacterium]
MSNVVSRFPWFHGTDDASKRWAWAAIIAVLVVAGLVVAWGFVGPNGWLESILFEE